MRKRGGTQLFCTHEPATSQTVTHPGISFSVIPVFYVAVLLETPIWWIKVAWDHCCAWWALPAAKVIPGTWYPGSVWRTQGAKWEQGR